MKIIADRAALMEAANLVAAVVPARSPSPALSCLKLTAEKHGGVGTLTVAGTDAEASLEMTLTQVDVSQPGVAVVSAEKLKQILGAVAEGAPTITMELDGDQCKITGSHAKFRIFAFPAGDYPPFPDFAAAIGSATGPGAARSTFIHSAGGLLALVTRTVFATARETSRYAINGVLLKRDGRKIEMVATDGRRLALSRSTLKPQPGGGGAGGSGGESTPVSCIIPTRALNLLTRLAGDPEASVRIAVTDNRVFFAFYDVELKGKEGKDASGGSQSPRAILSSTLVEGTFPPYEDVIPKDHDKKATTGRDELSSAVRQASVLTNEESRGIRMTFSGKNKSVRLSSRAPELGDSEIDLGLTAYEGEDLTISFNPAFIADALRAVPEPEVMWEFKASNKPGVMKVGAEFLYVIMPVNLPE
jgi:DNA polymerase-3 subunit beta